MVDPSLYGQSKAYLGQSEAVYKGQTEASIRVDPKPLMVNTKPSIIKVLAIIFHAIKYWEPKYYLRSELLPSTLV